MNTETTLAGRNTPVKVGANVLVNTLALVVGSYDVVIRQYEDGVLSFGNKALQSKATFGTFEQIRGYFSALSTVMDSPEGVFVTGFHLAKGWEYVKNVWDAPTEYGHEKPVAYVNFGLLQDSDVLKKLAGFGIKQGKSGNNWLALSASRGKLFPLYTIRFETRQAFLERADKVIEGGVTEWKELPVGWRNNYDRNIATYHKHYGIEAVLRLVAGTLKVVVTGEHVQDFQAPRLEKQFEMLFATKEERQDHYRTAVDNKNAHAQLRRAAVLVSNEETTDYVRSAADLGVAEVYQDGGTGMAAFEDLYDRNVRFVYADGSTARPGKAWIRKNHPEDVLGAVALAETFGAYVTVVEE